MLSPRSRNEINDESRGIRRLAEAAAAHFHLSFADSESLSKGGC